MTPRRFTTVRILVMPPALIAAALFRAVAGPEQTGRVGQESIRTLAHDDGLVALVIQRCGL
jgi:hypothetical protein